MRAHNSGGFSFFCLAENKAVKVVGDLKIRLESTVWYITAFDRSWMSICTTSVNNPLWIVFLDQCFDFVDIKFSGRCGLRQLSWFLFLYWYCAHCHELNPRAVWSTWTVRCNCSLERLLISSGSHYKLAKFPIQLIWNLFATDSLSNLKKHWHLVNLNGVKSTYDSLIVAIFL